MSDGIDDFRALKQYRQLVRGTFGRPCPVCVEKLPRAHPKILLPQQVCRAHQPHYRDPRPELTQHDVETMPQGDPIAFIGDMK